MTIVNGHGSDIDHAVNNAIETAWLPGKQNTKKFELLQEQLTEIKLKGNPWWSSGDETTGSRQLLAQIISNLSSIHWKFCASINIKGGTDSLFFIQHHQQEPIQTCIVSMNRNDRLRLIGFDNDYQAVQQCINDFYQRRNNAIKARAYHGSTEFKLPGYPFHCSGSEAIKTRRLVNRLIETLQNNGYHALTGIDISRKPHDKSIIALVKSVPCVDTRQSSAACIALSDVDKLRLIDFPGFEQERLAGVIRSYRYGILSQKKVDGSCLEFKLRVSFVSTILATDLSDVLLNFQKWPWHKGGPDGIQGKALLMHLLKKANELNWQLVASLDVSAKYHHRDNGPDYPLDVHSWFFTKVDTNGREFDAPPSAPPLTSDQIEMPPPTYEEALSLSPVNQNSGSACAL